MIVSQEEFRAWTIANPVIVEPGSIARLRPDFNGKQQLFSRLFTRQDVRPAITRPEQLFEWVRTRERLKTTLNHDMQVVVLTQPEYKVDTAIMLPDGQIGYINPRKLELVP